MKSCNWGGQARGTAGAFAPLVCMLKEALIRYSKVWNKKYTVYMENRNVNLHVKT